MRFGGGQFGAKFLAKLGAKFFANFSGLFFADTSRAKASTQKPRGSAHQNWRKFREKLLDEVLQGDPRQSEGHNFRARTQGVGLSWGALWAPSGTPFSGPLLRTLPQNPSQTFSEPFLERCVAVRPLRRAPKCSHPFPGTKERTFPWKPTPPKFWGVEISPPKFGEGASRTIATQVIWGWFSQNAD